MNRDRFLVIRELVEQALELPPDRREAFLDDVRGLDDDIRSQARSLLSYDLADAQDEAGPDAVGDAADMPSLTGTSLGRFRIGERIGDGGMGAVYLAEQTAPVKLRAAVKVIKFGMDTREVIARFEMERQALSMMDHPNIARVLDAGATAEGRPYFAMEFIDGPPLTVYCERHRLGLWQRLLLFTAVCRGIQHAHQRGIIHRDIKPGNILVAEQDGRPVPKIIDFGVARAIETSGAGRTSFTGLGRLIGTPEYMSPEQADPREAAVDTRSDVYSLGALLYELLTGGPPFTRREILRAGRESLRAQLRGLDPPLPSTRLRQASTEALRAKRPEGREARTLARHVRGDLDWVTMKALAKERDGRYRSAAELADDVERFLSHQPVLSGPPSSVYRMRKFVRRHRLGVVMGALLTLVLLAGSVGTSIGMIRARRAEAAALLSARQAEAAGLYHVARNHPNQTFAAAYALRAIELDDRPRYRDQMMRSLLQAGPVWRLPAAQDAHNPHSVGISPDGRWLAVGWAERGVVQLYDRRAGGEATLLDGHRLDMRSLCFSGDSRFLATAGSDSMVLVRSPEKPETFRKLRCSGMPFVFADDGGGRLITAEAATGLPLSFRAWDWEGGVCRELGSAGPVLTAPWPEAAPQIDRAGRWLALPVGDRVELYDIRNLAAGRVRSLASRGAEVVAVALSHDGRLCAAVDNRHGVLIWDLERRDEEPARRLQSTSRTFSAAFSPDSRRLAICCAAGLEIWDLGLPSAAAPRTLLGSNLTFAAAFDPAHPWIVTVGTSMLVGAWPLAASAPIALRLETGVAAALAFSRDGRWLVTGSDAGSIQAWPLTGTGIGEPRTLLQRDGYVFERLRIDDEGRFVYATTCNGERGFLELLRLSLDDGDLHTWRDVTCVIELDASGRRLAMDAGSIVGISQAEVLDLATGARCRLDGPDGGAKIPLGFLADGRLLAQNTSGLGAWDPAGGASELLHRGWLWGVLADDRQTLLLVGDDGRLSLGRYDDPVPAPLRSRFDPFDPRTLMLDEHGALIVSCAGTEVVEVVDTAADVKHRLPLFKSLGYDADFDPAGRWLAVAGDGVVKLVPLPLPTSWEGMGREELLSLLSGATNLRAVRDDSLAQGYRMVGWGLPDWERPLRW